MKKVFDNLNKNKYITLFFGIMLAFGYIGGARKYIYDNCTKIIDFGRMGSSWFNLSSGIAVLMAVAVCVGIAVTILLRKKITIDWVLPAYGVVGIVSIITLLFTPYNLQLLSPKTQLDSFATITTIAVIVFSLISVILLSATISAHILIVLDSDKLIATIVSGVTICIAAMFALFSVVFEWSLQIYFIVLTSLLLVFYATNTIANAIVKKSDDCKICLANCKINWLYVSIIIAIAVVTIIAVLATSAVVVEKAIAI